LRNDHPGRWLNFTQQKNRERKPVPLMIPIVPELEEIIANSPCGDLTFLVTAFGKPFTAAGFGNWFRERCDEAGLYHCSAHGLRKAGATIAAENGATERQLMAIFGWRTSKQAVLYTRSADQKALAGSAMTLLSPKSQPTD
jgi:integrase